MLKNIQLQNFRTFESITLSFAPGVNILVGENGVGKTSILEAVYLLNFTKSFKTTRDIDMLRHRQESFHITTQWDNEKYSEGKANFWKVKNQKKFFLDNEEITRFSRIVGSFPMIFHSPEDSRITRGTQTERRSYFDKFFSQVSAEYLNDLILFRRIMKTKNAYLKYLLEKKQFDYTDQLKIYNQQLLPVMYKIVSFRKSMVQQFNTTLKKVYQDCFMGDPEGQIVYKASADGDSEETFNQNFLKCLEENFIREISMKRCLYGPGQDQYTFYRNNIPMKHFASQGEHKIWLICLKLAEGRILESQIQQEPLFLFDDLFAELDVNNSEKIIQEVKNRKQVLITTTDLNDIYRQGLFTKNDEIHVIKIKKTKELE